MQLIPPLLLQNLTSKCIVHLKCVNALANRFAC